MKYVEIKREIIDFGLLGVFMFMCLALAISSKMVYDGFSSVNFVITILIAMLTGITGFLVVTRPYVYIEKLPIKEDK